MNIKTEDVSSTRKCVTVSFSSDEIAKEQNGLITQFSTQAKIPGFRPGKAPANLVRQRYAKELREELNRKIVSAAYENLSKDDSVKIYGLVNIDGDEIDATKDAEIKLTIDVVPEFELPEYKGLEIHKHPEEISEEEIQEAIDRIRSQRAEYNPVERAAEASDYVKVSYEGKIGDEAIADLVPDKPIYGKQAVTWEEAGSEDSPGVQAVVQGIIGMAKGDKKTVEQEFDKEFEVEALQGKKATYEVEVLEVREKVLPELDEEFLKSLQIESEEELRQKIREQIEGQKKQENDQHMRQQLLDAISEKLDFEVPESAIERETQSLVGQHMQHYMQQGVTEDMFEEHKDQLFESAKGAALKQVKSEFILSKIAESEKVEVGDEDMKMRIMQEAYMSRTSPDKLVKELQKDRGRVDQMRRAILFNKTLEFLVESANVTVQEHCDHKHDDKD